MKPACILMFIFLFSLKERPVSEIERRIKSVESQLSPPIIIEGRERQTFEITERMAHYRIPAVSIAVINSGKIEWAKAYGYLSDDNTTKADTLTLFQAGVVSQCVSALAALKLAQEYRLQLDGDANLSLKEWKIKTLHGSPITLRHLLSHTSGINSSALQAYLQHEKRPSLQEILNGPELVGVTPAGTRFAYNGRGYSIVQKMIEDVTDADFATVMQQLVLSKIGMRHSSYRQPLPDSLLVHASPAHEGDEKKIPGTWRISPEIAAVGLWTTPIDLAKYIVEVQQSVNGKSNRVLSKEMTGTMLTKQAPGTWGLGPNILEFQDSVGFAFASAFEGYCTFFFGSVHSGKGAVIMMNSSRGFRLVEEIRRSISDTYQWGIYDTIKKKPILLSSEQMALFPGIYSSTEDSKLTVKIISKRSHLLVEQSWDGAEISLFPESQFSFFNEQGPVTFQVDGDGSVVGLNAFNHFKFVKVK